MSVFKTSHAFKSGTRITTKSKDAIMSVALNERLSKIPDRIRNRADVSKPNSIQSTIRVRSMDATMSALRRLNTISDPLTYANVARGLMLIGSSSPIRCICVGIKPYENGILPSFATALAYSPRLCIGVTPSVQVLSQLMSLSAMKIKDKIANRHGITDGNGFITRDEYTARFAIMLRCSYSCVEAGVAFVNSSPVIVGSIAKECLSSSIFSEWIANMVMIHAELGIKLLVLSMGASADECLNEATSAYPTMSSNMTLIKTPNPAAIARMNVSRRETPCPIPNVPMVAELYIDKMMGTDLSMSPRAGFNWNTYPDQILEKFMGSDSVSGLVELLVDHAPVRLLNEATNTIRNTYVVMSDFDIENMVESVGVAPSQAESGAEKTNWADSTNEYHSETVPGNENTQPDVPMNPFHNIETSQATNQGGGRSDNGNNNRDGNKFGGPYGVTERSQLGQLLDPSGKGVSQQVIVIESFNQRANEIMTSYKEISSNMGELVKRQTTIMDILTKMGHVDASSYDEAVEFLDTFKEFCESVMEKMEEAYGVVEGLPAVVEGDRGIYELETMPVAPLMRRDDGKTMKQYVYGPAHESSRRSGTDGQSANETTQQPAAQPPSVSNPFNMGQDRDATEDTSLSTNLLEHGDETYIGIATQAVIEGIRSTEFGQSITSKTVYESLRNYPMTVGNMSTTMFEVMSTIVAQKMTLNSGESLDEEMIDSLIGCLGGGTIDELTEMEPAFTDAIMNDTSIESFFEQLMLSDGEDE